MTAIVLLVNHLTSKSRVGHRGAWISLGNTHLDLKDRQQKWGGVGGAGRLKGQTARMGKGGMGRGELKDRQQGWEGVGWGLKS